MNVALRAVLRIVLTAACPVACAAAGAAGTIVIIRHGEKPPAGLGQLTCQGLNRALALPSVLLERFGTPVAIHAPNPAAQKKDNGVPYAYVRPLATIEPLAIRVGLPVQLDGAMEEVEPLADRLLAGPDGTQVVAWEHHWGEALARRLLAAAGADPAVVPRWADDDFDSMYLVRLSRDGTGRPSAAFRVERQGLDNLPDQCPAAPARAPGSR